MYNPNHFKETGQTRLHDFIQQNSFGLLVSQVDGKPFASHLPLLLDRQSGPQGCVIGHMARANPQWQQAEGQEVLVVFSGPHAYISPAWYEAEQVVPTWNYVAVHVYGRLKIIQEQNALVRIVQDSVAFYDQSWSLDGPKDFMERMVRMIVGFRIQIERMEGKWKLNQNHPRERREKVIQALRGRTDENSKLIAELMDETLESE